MSMLHFASVDRSVTNITELALQSKPSHIIEVRQLQDSFFRLAHARHDLNRIRIQHFKVRSLSLQFARTLYR